jgi:acetylcholinesterase
MEYLANATSDAPMIFQLPSISWKEGRFNKIPLLTSFTNNEGNMYAPEDLTTNDEALEWVQTFAPGLDEIDLQIITELYPDPITNPFSQYKDSPISPQFDRLGALYSDYSYICAAQENAIHVSQAEVPVWKMHFNTNNSRPYYRGIDHATDRTYAWNEPTVQFPAVGKALHAYWASFVVSGDPNEHKLEDATIWPRYEKGETKLGVQLRMDNNGSIVEKDTIRRAGCDFWRARHVKLTR